MKILFRSLLLVCALVSLALGLAACGGGDDEVPSGAVALVDGDEVARTDYDALINQAKKSYKNQKREFPKAGSQEFQTLKNQAVQFLVQREQFEQQAEDLDINVTDKQVADRLEQIKKQYFGGDAKKYEKQLKEQGLTDANVRRDIRAQLIQEKIFEEVTKDTKVTDKQIEDYYKKNKAQYSQPASRDVRHILVKTKAKAEELKAQLDNGGDFAALAKQHSTDTGSKANGGKLTISKGQTVAPFDATAFALKKNAISPPVKTDFGFHIIQALSDVKAAKVTPLKDVKESIKQQLLQTEKNEQMTKWVDDLTKDYEDKVSYAVGFSPPPQATGTTTTAEEK
jgi:parvulin-like peptidyl-prolyl isomerase